VIEFATFYGVEDGFVDNVKKFAQLLENASDVEIRGYHDVVIGEVVEEIAKGGVDEGKAQAVHLWIVSEPRIKSMNEANETRGGIRSRLICSFVRLSCSRIMLRFSERREVVLRW